MPWSHCGVQFILDDEGCPNCGMSKDEWTVQLDSTRVFRVATKRLGAPAAASWIELELRDAGDAPLGGVPCRVELPDSRVSAAPTDAAGRVRVEDFPPGACRVTFAGFAPADDDDPEDDPRLLERVDGPGRGVECASGAEHCFQVLAGEVPGEADPSAAAAGAAAAEPEPGEPGPAAAGATDADAALLAGLEAKRVDPQSFAEALGALQAARERIAATGRAEPKYSEAELVALGRQGTLEGRYIVRFVGTNRLDGRDGEELGGYLGPKRKGEDEVKYWSTTFDQLEDADTDPRLICNRLGIRYDPQRKYSLAIVDQEQARESAGAHTFVPTYENLGAFAHRELGAKLERPELIDEVLTEEYSQVYAEAYQAGGDAIWSPEGRAAFLEEHFATDEERARFQTRLQIHSQLGANEDFLGNGLTKNNLDPERSRYGVLETFTYERDPQTFARLSDAGAVTIIRDLDEIPGLG